MTSLRMRRGWIYCLIGTTVLQAVVIISISGTSCSPETACNPASVELANLSFPLRRLNVSSTCGDDNSTRYCMPEDSVTCDDESAISCSAGEHAAERMVEWSSSSDEIAVHPPTYWQSENSVATTGTQPTPQYVEVRSEIIYTENTEFLKPISTRGLAPKTPLSVGGPVPLSITINTMLLETTPVSLPSRMPVHECEIRNHLHRTLQTLNF